MNKTTRVTAHRSGQSNRMYHGTTATGERHPGETPKKGRS